MAEDKKEKRERKSSLFILAVLLMIVLGAATGLLSLALGTGRLGFDLFASYFLDTRLLLFNITPVVLLHLAVYMLVGRPWLAFLLSSGAVLFFSFLEELKLRTVSDVLWFSDIVSGEAFDYVSDPSSIKLSLLAIGCVIYLIAFTTVLLVLFLRRRSAWFGGRIILFALLAGFSFWGFKQVTNTEKYPVEPSYDVRTELSESTREYVSRGFIYPLMLSVGQDTAETAPGGYSADKAAEMLAAYGSSDIADDKAVSIIAIQLESFADFSGLDTGSVDTASAYEDYDRVRAFALSGTLVTGGSGWSGTVSQRSLLTGFVSLGTIRTYTNSYVHYLKAQGYAAQGVEFADPRLKNRERISTYLGFDNFEYAQATEDTDGVNGAGNTDWTLYSRVYDMWKKGLQSGNPKQFIFAVSTQNAAPYDTKASHFGSYVKDNVPAAQRTVLNNYLGALRASFFYLSNMLDRMEADDAPVVVLIYSSGEPELGDAQELLTGTAETKTGYARYIIWANSAAKAVLGTEFTGKGRTLSTAFLIPELFRLCGYCGPSFMKAAQEISESVPVMLEGGKYMLPGSTELIGELPLELQSRAYNFNYMEYYEKTNFRYQR